MNGSSFNITAATNWQSSNTAVATIGARTGIALGLTTGSTNITGSFQSITSDASTLSVTNYAYIVNNGSNTVESCIAQANGTITNCNTISGFTSPYAIAINPTRTFAYITEPSSNHVQSCNLSFTSCSSTGDNFDSPTGIALDPKGHFAYITNGNESVTYCNSDPVTGTLSSCTIYYLDNNLPTSAIAINKSGNIAYIISNDPSLSTTILYYCSINTLTGALSDCASTGSNFLDNGSNLGLALASDDSYLYISNTAGGIYACPINSTNNKVESCTNTGATNLSNPYGLSIGRNNEYAFIANFASNQIVSCTLTNAYTFSNCQIAVSTGTNPTGVVVN